MIDAETTKIIEWALMSILSGACAWSVKILSDISKSIALLNIQVGTILEKTAWHEKALERHEQRLSSLEKKR